jgi:hypothetical protein
MNNAKLRKSIYGVGVAGAGVLLVYGFLNEQEAAAWLLLFGAICGLAFYNTDTSDS